MRRSIMGMTLFFAMSLGAAAQTQYTPVTIVVTGAQHSSQTGSFIPQSAPYLQGPSVSVYLPSGQEVRTADGLAIIGLSFRGWVEGDATRVQVSALVPRSGAPDVDLRYRPEFLELRNYATYRIRAGERIPITEMLGHGLEPMVLTARSFQDLFAAAMRLREALLLPKF